VSVTNNIDITITKQVIDTSLQLVPQVLDIAIGTQNANSDSVSVTNNAKPE